VTGIKFCTQKFPTFSLGDLERIKDTEKWLSDSHVAFSLMLAPVIFWSVSTLMKHRHSFGDSAQKHLWGNLKIQLLDTPFWSQLREDPDKFTEKYRSNVNLLEHDFVVMPMFERFFPTFFFLFINLTLRCCCQESLETWDH
jgi:hypothetical protein